MTLLAIGINHQTAPVELRERVAFADHALPAALEGLRELPSVREVVLLSTCNRTELYAVTEDDGRALDAWMASHPADAGRHDMAAYLYRHQDADAVRHLFRVATGLDSLVLGEPQILGQVKQAWAAARSAGTLGGQLDRLFQQAFVAAKRARTDTRIGANPVSVASTAVHLAQATFARLEDAVVLLVGAGETIELVARHLSRVKRLLVANRTLAHAQDLASRHGGVALPLDELQRHLAEADIVFCATASRDPVIRRAQVEAALSQRRHRPMLLLDLAVPRDVEPAVADLKDAFLYTIDDLERAVEDNRRSRREAAEAAEAIVDLQVARYVETQQASGRVAPVKRLRAHGESARDEVLAKAQQQLAAGHEPAEVLEFLANTLTNRLLHAPTVALRQAALEGDAALARASEKLFPAPTDKDD
ncbi:glutamyl-tRNA reductase [Luteimonas sp. 8-5]|uniref:glutamyl-tRNA reductase n=1 Tax=Luteimonas sp. 8-5 TaxID=3039387 RepID=UPI002437238B|nr:glutamyl-tRNA reductase [Luteimonas sp. 8-5]MDG6348697.1 glutamyl-tRNA reductase [Luteimonas sp. 8-5]